VNDNVLPLASQIVADMYFDPEYLNLPRMGLIPSGEPGYAARLPKLQTPHASLIGSFFDDGEISFEQVR